MKMIWVHPDLARAGKPAIQIAERDLAGDLELQQPVAEVGIFGISRIVTRAPTDPADYPHVWLETYSKIGIFEEGAYVREV